jgi:hypothetical protein
VSHVTHKQKQKQKTRTEEGKIQVNNKEEKEM